jgi:hypothetical protein
MPIRNAVARLDIVLIFLIVVAFALKLHAALVFEINWDEFLNLSWIYDYRRGELSAVLHTVYVHWFGWLASVSANEVDQIVAARLVMFALNLATAWLIYRISHEFFSRTASLLAVLAYLSFSFVFRHETAFRTDAMSTFLLMLALWLMISSRLDVWRALFAGALIGLAGLVTVKSIFYAPIFAVVLSGRLLLAEDRRAALVRAALVVLSAIVGFGAFYGLHALSLAGVDDFAPFVTRAYSKTIAEQSLIPQAYWLRTSMIENFVFWMFLLAGIVIALFKAVQTRGAERVRWFMVLSFASILSTLLFYLNAYPYYYVFMLAPAVVLCAATADQVPPSRRTVALTVVTVIFAGSVVANYARVLTQDNSDQRATLAAIHEMFPEPVAYIDRTSMISRYSKVGFFMASWQMAEYWDAGEPVMRKAILEGQPRFLLVNSQYLDLWDPASPQRYQIVPGLLAEDRQVLRDNFIHHWGRLYVAGKEIDLTPLAPRSEFEILISGTYTLEGTGAVSIDGEPVEPGSAIDFEPGMHSIAMIQTPGQFALRIGRNLRRPATPASSQLLFRGF